MLKPVKPVDNLTAARIVELLDPKTPWNRALWNLSLGLTLKEVLEAIEANGQGILGDSAVKALVGSAKKLAGADPSIASKEKDLLNSALSLSSKEGFPSHEGFNYHVLEELASRMDRSYLQGWAEALKRGRAGTSPYPEPERTARSVAAHLLDLGFSEEYLHAWWVSRLHDDSSSLKMDEIFELAADELQNKPAREFEILIAFKNAPHAASGFPEEWLKDKQVATWLWRNDFDRSKIRLNCGLVLKICARDPVAAAHLATSRLDHLVARVAVANGRILEPGPAVWIKGEAEAFTLKERIRGVRLEALYREDQIFVQPESGIDAAIELLAHLERSSPSAAIAGGWAAIEALLAEPENKSEAAQNIAWLVACSFPRAELTTLSYKVDSADSNIERALSSCRSNRDRAVVLAKAIFAGAKLGFKSPADQAALRRMGRLLKSNAAGLTEIQGHVAEAFLRLYRQRNLVLHGGRSNGVALQGSLRTAAKLAGAGMDRIVHGWYVKKLRPLELAARAKVAIRLIPEGDPAACADPLGS